MTPTTSTRLEQTIPAMPVRDAAAAVAVNPDPLGPVSAGGVEDSDLGTREVAALDRDGNLVTSFRWVSG